MSGTNNGSAGVIQATYRRICHPGAGQIGTASGYKSGKSEIQHFAKPAALHAADRDLAAFFVIHTELIRGFEPGHHLTDAIDINDVTAVGAPEDFRIEAGLEFFESTEVRLAFEIAGDQGDDAARNRCVDQILGIMIRFLAPLFSSNLLNAGAALWGTGEGSEYRSPSTRRARSIVSSSRSRSTGFNR